MKCASICTLSPSVIFMLSHTTRTNIHIFFIFFVHLLPDSLHSCIYSSIIIVYVYYIFSALHTLLTKRLGMFVFQVKFQGEA